MAKRPPAKSRSRPARRAGSVRKRKPGRRSRQTGSATAPRAGGLTVTELDELTVLRRELERAAATASPPRWNADPDEVQRSVAHLVLTLVEFIRRILERQAIRRMEAGTLTEAQTEDVGRALMQLEQTVREVAARFGVPFDELNVDLGPVGKLM